MMHDKILILDFGSQYTQLIARRVRASHVYCESHPHDVGDQFIQDFNPRGIILSGGPGSAFEVDSFQVGHVVFELGVPVLGICYGMQLMASRFGGQVSQAALREFGLTKVHLEKDKPCLGLETCASDQLSVWMSHGDQVDQLPLGFETIASTPSAPIAMMADYDRHFYGVQFHPEVTHTQCGSILLAHFLLKICGCRGDWVMPAFQEEAVLQLQKQVGSDTVILGLSGGVDSAVAAALLHKAIGRQLVCVFVDHGLLRLNEAEQVTHIFKTHLGVNVVLVEAKQRFLSALLGVSDPEEKRRIMGKEFVEIFQEEAKKYPEASWLGQGTIYPDVIESAGGKTKKGHNIKSHHNVGGLPDTLNLKLCEPLRELFKDEVRELGRSLGLPDSLIGRHPFPGPGLGVRILGEITEAAADKLRRADAIFMEELQAAGWYDQVAQAFVVFLPVSSVGVMGDGRTYENVVALRAVQTTDFMTAHWAYLPYELLNQVSTRIVNEVAGINRVVYDVSSKPPATIEWE